ncbi:MAG: FkbM family methyltransferase [Proteobacteria bacterium]|nr:FkbM family methyltransferase [Pseudomonadota bacterium]
MSKLRLLLSKASLNFLSDFKFLAAHHISITDRLIYLVSKYIALLTARHDIRYLGSDFYYDNYWTPTLLQHYPQEIETLKRYIDTSAITTLLDVGANLGQFAATWRHYSPGTIIYSFEPNRDIYPLLQKNAHQDPGWITLPHALGRQQATIDFYYVPQKSAQGSFFASNAAANLLTTTTIKTEVSVISLTPETCQELGVPQTFDLIKIDTEGAEEQVPQGLIDIRWRYLYIECSMDREGAMAETRLWALMARMKGALPRLLYKSQPAVGGMSYDVLVENMNF